MDRLTSQALKSSGDIRVRSSKLSRLRKILFIILLFVPSVYILYLLTLYGMDAPFWDEWELVVYLVKAHANTLTLSDLWMQHNEHRLFFPRLIMLAVAYPTNWNLKCHLYVNFAVAAIAFLFIYLLLRSTFDKQIPKWLLVASSFLIFSPVQWENWSGGLVILFFLNVLNIAAAAYLMNRWSGRWTGLVAAIVFAVIASYTISSGLLAWVALFPLFLRKSWKKEHVIMWIFAFAITAAFYFLGYTKPAHHPSLLFFIHHPYEFAKYVFAYLGGPIARGWGTRGSVCIGFVSLASLSAVIVYLRRLDKDGFDKFLPWLATGAYALLSAVVTGVGRAGFGVKQALASRYTTGSTLFTISAMVAVALLAYRYRMLNKKPLTKNIVVYCVMALTVALYALSFLQGVSEFKSRKVETDSARVCVKDFESADDECLQVFYPEAAHLRQIIGLLSENGLLEKIWWYQKSSK